MNRYSNAGQPSRYRSVKYKLARENSVSSCFEEKEQKTQSFHLPCPVKYTYSRNKKNFSQTANISPAQPHQLNGELANEITKMHKSSYM